MTGTRLASAPLRRVPDRAPPIDPRIRARLIEVQRDRGRRRRRIVSGIAVGVAVAAAGWGTTRSPLLKVRTVVITGATHTGRNAVLAASGLNQHRQMLDVSPALMRLRLEALPWVGRVGIVRHWPTTVSIAIVERVAVAEVAGPAGQPALVDAGGRVLATGSDFARVLAGAGQGLPLLVGVPPAGPAGSLLPPDAHGLLALVAALPNAMSAAPAGGPAVHLKQVLVSPDGTLSAVLASGVIVVFGSVEQLAAKVLAMQTVLQQVSLVGVATVDVRVPDSPVLTKANGGSMVSTIPRG